MDEWGALGKVLIVTGCSVALLGLALVFSDRLSGFGTWFGWIGKLPGDIAIKRDHVSFYAPLGTGLLFSIVLSLLFYFLSWLFKR
jgi:hypothetical protein